MKTKNKKAGLHPMLKNNRGPGEVSKSRSTRRIARKVPPAPVSDEKVNENDGWFFFWDL